MGACLLIVLTMTDNDEATGEVWTDAVNPDASNTKTNATPTSSIVNVKMTNIMMQLRKCCNHPYLCDWPTDKEGNPVADESLVTASAPLDPTNLLVLTTPPIFYAFCMRNHHIITGNVADGRVARDGQSTAHYLTWFCAICFVWCQIYRPSIPCAGGRTQII